MNKDRLFLYKNTVLVFLMDAILIAASMYLAFAIRFEFRIPRNYVNILLYLLPLSIFIKMAALTIFRVYRGRWRYMTLQELLDVLKAIIIGIIGLIFSALLVPLPLYPPRSIFLLDGGLTIIFIAGIRASIRLYYIRKKGVDIFPALSRLFKPRRKNLMISEAGMLLVDALLVVAALWSAYAIRFDFRIPQNYLNALVNILPFVLVIKLITFTFFHLYQSIWRFAGLFDFLNIIKATITSTMGSIMVVSVLYRFEDYPRSVFIIDWVMTVILIGGFRIGIRLYFAAKDSSLELFPSLSEIGPQGKKFFIVGVGDFFVDAGLVVISFYVAYAIRFEFAIPPDQVLALFNILPFVLIVKMGTFVFFRMYQRPRRLIGLVQLFTVIKAVVVSTMGIILVVVMMHRFEGYPRSVFFIDCGLTLLLLVGLRVAIRMYFYPVQTPDQLEETRFRLTRQVLKNLKNEKVPDTILEELKLLQNTEFRRKDDFVEAIEESIGTAPMLRYKDLILKYTTKEKKRRLLIIGASTEGEKVLRDLAGDETVKPVGFLDDNLAKQGRTIHGVKVLGAFNQIASFQALFDEVLIADPSLAVSRRQTIVEVCEQTGKKLYTKPFIAVEMVHGRGYVDLLGREEVHLDREEISAYLRGKRVLVTGAGGSIGSELIRQVCPFGPGKLALVEMSELHLTIIDKECRRRFNEVELSSFLCDIRDQKAINWVFQEFQPEVVLHAAAYKHVPIQEVYPWEAVRNNVLGTRNLVQAAQTYGVERFVKVSTDKAVRPTNVMGATKRVAEKLITCVDGKPRSRFMIIRFGNVLGSSGSVIPTFREQIEKQGGPVTVTHPDMIRYFMTIPEAVQLLLQAGAMGQGGEIFLLAMGQPVRIADLARKLIRAYGKEPVEEGESVDPEKHIVIKYTGLRPGEKIYEELITEGENIVETDNEKIMVLRGDRVDAASLYKQVDELLEMSWTFNSVAIKKKIQEIVPEYTPQF